MLSLIKSWIRNYFGFSRTETNGFVVLSLLMLAFIAAPFLYPYFVTKKYTQAIPDQQLLDSVVAQMRQKPASSDQPGKPVQPELQLAVFDPNTIGLPELLQFGLPEWLAQRIINYREKVRPFSVKSDLRKIYGLDPELYQKLHPYVSLPDEIKQAINTAGKAELAEVVEKKPSPKHEKPQVSITTFDLNQADTIQLKKIKGIGSKLSSRIIKYREILGGFISLDQLQDIYGLNPYVIDQLRSYSYIETGYKPQLIPINFIEFKTLLKHPYIDYETTKKIINHRSNNGPFRQKEDLLNQQLVTDSIYHKLVPYLSF